MELSENQIKALNWAGWTVRYLREDDKDTVISKNSNDSKTFVEISYYSDLHFDEEDVEDYLNDLVQKYDNYIVNNKGRIIKQVFEWDRTKTKRSECGNTLQVSPKRTTPVHKYILGVAPPKPHLR